MSKPWLFFLLKLIWFSKVSHSSPSFNNTPQARSLGELGGSITLSWEITDANPEFIRWFRTNDKNEIVTNIMYIALGNPPVVNTASYGGRVSKSGSAKLTIDKLKESDEGWVGCSVDLNGGRAIFDKVYLDVGRRPRNTLISLASVPTENKNLNLSCTTSSKPEAQITWLDKDDNVLQNSSRYYIRAPTSVYTGFETQAQSIFVIINIQINQTGLLKCRVENLLGSETLNTSIIVQYKPINTALQLQFDTSLEGDLNQLTCTANGIPMQIWYQFYFGSVLLQNSTGKVFVLNPVKNYNQGEYKCVPRNLVGEGASDTKSLSVNVKPYIFDTKSANITINEGDPVSIACNFRGKPSPDVTWEKQNSNNNLLNVNTQIKQTNATLVELFSEVKILPAKREDYGTYTCFGKNPFGETKYSIALYVQYEPSITYTTLDQENFYAKEGASDSFKCSATASPQPIIKWYRSSVEIVDERHSISNNVDEIGANFVKVSSILNLNDLSKYDTGKLKCEASNVVGKVSEETNFNVYYKPEITAQMSPAVYVNLGSGLSLSCSAKSIEQSKFYWYKNEKLIVSNKDRSQIEEIKVGNEFVSSYLSINPISNDDSNVVFTCLANNSLGMDSKSTLVTVYFGPKIVQFPASWIITYEHNSVYRINCVAQANPKPSIVWFKNGKMLTFNDTKSTYTLFEYVVTSTSIITIMSSTVVLNDVKRNDYGNWTCQASNNIVQKYSVDQQTTRLTVTYPPEFEFLPPNPFPVNVSNNVILLCRIKASPKPYVWWQLPFGIEPDKRYSFTSSVVEDDSEFGSIIAELTILSITKREYGEYSCMTNNSIVSNTKSIKLVVQYPPTSVPDFQVPIQTYPESSIKFIQVSVEANPPPNIDWFISRDNGTSYRKLTENIETTQLILVRDFEYKIQSRLYFPAGILLRADQAFYKARVSHIFGVKELVTWLIVYWKPEIETRIPASEKISLYQKISFICRFYSNPMSQINWFKNEVLITDIGYLTTPLKVNSSMTLSESTLTFLNVLKSDRANYSCTASNGIGSATMWHYLDVLYPPELSVVPSDIFIEVGDNLALSCAADGNPPIYQYNWRKSNKSLDVNQETLVITNAQQDTQGNYSCIPQNSEGVGDSINYAVFVIIPPKFILPATCEKSTNNIYTCSCEGVGFPSPDVFWTKYGNNEVIGDGQFLNFTSSVANDGTYVCHLKIFNNEITTYFQIADFTPIYGIWSQWSVCNVTCSTGISFRNRVCFLQPCSGKLSEMQVCTGTCPDSLSGKEEVNWYYALYAIIPCVLLLIVLGILWIIRKNRIRNGLAQQN